MFFKLDIFVICCHKQLDQRMDLKIFGKIIREKRNNLNLRQEELSEKSGVAIKTIHSIELGKGNPAIKTILRIFNILELDFIVVSAKTTVNQ
jgi:transcriptional regulator with XRE-family HTH domain